MAAAAATWCVSLSSLSSSTSSSSSLLNTMPRPSRLRRRAVQGGGVLLGGKKRTGYGQYYYYSNPPPTTTARRVNWPATGRPAHRSPQPPAQDEAARWREWDEREAQLEVQRAQMRERELAERAQRRMDVGTKRRMVQQYRETSARAEQTRLEMERARQLREAQMRDRLSRAAAAPLRSRNRQAAEFIRDEREFDELDRRPRASTSYDGFDYFDDDLWPRAARTGFGRWVSGLFEEQDMREQQVRGSRVRRRQQVGDDPYTAFAARPRQPYVENREPLRRATQPVAAAGAPRDDDFLDYTPSPPSSSSPSPSSRQGTEGDAYQYNRTPQQRARYVDPRGDDEFPSRARRRQTRAADETDSEVFYEGSEPSRRRSGPRRAQQQRRKAPDFDSIRAALLGEASAYELFKPANQHRR